MQALPWNFPSFSFEWSFVVSCQTNSWSNSVFVTLNPDMKIQNLLFWSPVCFCQPHLCSAFLFSFLFLFCCCCCCCLRLFFFFSLTKLAGSANRGRCFSNQTESTDDWPSESLPELHCLQPCSTGVLVFETNLPDVVGGGSGWRNDQEDTFAKMTEMIKMNNFLNMSFSWLTPSINTIKKRERGVDLGAERPLIFNLFEHEFCEMFSLLL